MFIFYAFMLFFFFLLLHGTVLMWNSYHTEVFLYFHMRRLSLPLSVFHRMTMASRQLSTPTGLLLQYNHKQQQQRGHQNQRGYGGNNNGNNGNGRGHHHRSSADAGGHHGFDNRQHHHQSGRHQQSQTHDVVENADGDISRAEIWSLWNEGNLFSLAVPQLHAFLRSEGVPYLREEKKTALVRKVEEHLNTKEKQPVTVRKDDIAQITFDAEVMSNASELLDETDVYGDWGMDPGYEKRRDMDFFDISIDPYDTHKSEHMAPRAYQVLHDDSSADVRRVRLDMSRMAGHLSKIKAYTYVPAPAADANRERFVRAFEWAVLTMWNLGEPGELNITYGRMHLGKPVREHIKRNVIPIWSIQKELRSQRVMHFMSLAHEQNTDAVGWFLRENDFRVEEDSTSSYLVTVKRSSESVVVELNSDLQTSNVLRKWDRVLVSHYFRLKMPDVRFMVRARNPLKKKIANPFVETEILRMRRSTVQSVLAPELGEVTYAAERIISTWTKTISGDGYGVHGGIKLRLTQTKRSPLLTVVPIAEGERLEYELTAELPKEKDTEFDLKQVGGELFDIAREFAAALQPGMQPFLSNVRRLTGE